MIELKQLCSDTMRIFGVDDILQLRNTIKDCVLTNDTEKYAEFSKLVEDLSVDWLQMIFQYWYADRKEKMQDYTPATLAKTVAGEERPIANCIPARYDAGVSNFRQSRTAVAIPVITPDRPEKRQNGRRFKDNGDPSFTLTTQDQHGVAINVNEKLTAYAVWYEKYKCYIAIRKLTPKECFRLQGWTDDYFAKAEFVNSDSQLYKQAGNGVTVDVVEEIGKAIRRIIDRNRVEREVKENDYDIT